MAGIWCSLLEGQRPRQASTSRRELLTICCGGLGCCPAIRKESAMKQASLGLIRLYQRVLSQYWPGSCRYTPSCSNYAYDAVMQFGVMRGGWLALRRLSRCRPLGGSGYDPVPNWEHLDHVGTHLSDSVESDLCAIGENSSAG